jgi:hypothetical protein
MYTPVQLFVVFRWRIVRIKSSTAKQSCFLTKQLKWTSCIVPSMISNVQLESAIIGKYCNKISNTE